MKFSIGIESVNYLEHQINEAVVSDEDSLVNDNITHLQFQDYNSAIKWMLKNFHLIDIVKKEENK